MKRDKNPSSRQAPQNNNGRALSAAGAAEQTNALRQMLSLIVENSDDAIIGKRLDGTIISWNRAAEKLFGYRQREMIGQSITKIIPQDRIGEEARFLRRLRRGQHVDHYETVRIRKDGGLIDVSISISPIRGPDGKIIGASKIARDITERKEIESRRHQSEMLLRGILDAASDAIITIDEQGLIQSANAGATRQFGYEISELVGKNVNRLMGEPYHSEHDAYLRNYCRTGHAKIIGIGREVTGRRKDGSTFPMHLTVSEVKLKDRRLFTGIIHDLTGRRRLERQIMEVAANEQRRIGQDLHDGLCQDLVGIAFGIDNVLRNLPPSSAECERVAKLAQAVRDAANQARRLAHGLNPVDLKAGGLAVALENLAIKVADAFRISCTFRWDQCAQVRDDATATHMYRIAQESVSNAIRHGKATSVTIALAERDGCVALSVMDNGSGMSRAVVSRIRQGLALSGPNLEVLAGMGLQTMQYRAGVIGGTFAVTRSPGGGTIITCTLGRDQSVPQGKTRVRASGKFSRGNRGRSR